MLTGRCFMLFLSIGLSIGWIPRPPTIMCYQLTETGTFQIEMTGRDIKLSDFFNNRSIELSKWSIDCNTVTTKEIVVDATSSITLDVDIKAVGLEIKIVMNAPEWYVKGRRVINLSGNTPPQQPAALDAMRYGGNGCNGRNGFDGTNGGDFVGKFANIKNAELLTIISNGGNGGDGQDGGDGLFESTEKSFIDFSVHYNRLPRCNNKMHSTATPVNDYCIKTIVTPILPKQRKFVSGYSGGNGGFGGIGGPPGKGGYFGIIEFIGEFKQLANNITQIVKNGSPGKRGKTGRSCTLRTNNFKNQTKQAICLSANRVTGLPNVTKANLNRNDLTPKISGRTLQTNNGNSYASNVFAKDEYFEDTTCDCFNDIKMIVRGTHIKLSRLIRTNGPFNAKNISNDCRPGLGGYMCYNIVQNDFPIRELYLFASYSVEIDTNVIESGIEIFAIVTPTLKITRPETKIDISANREYILVFEHSGFNQRSDGGSFYAIFNSIDGAENLEIKNHANTCADGADGADGQPGKVFEALNASNSWKRDNGTYCNGPYLSQFAIDCRDFRFFYSYPYPICGTVNDGTYIRNKPFRFFLGTVASNGLNGEFGSHQYGNQGVAKFFNLKNFQRSVVNITPQPMEPYQMISKGGKGGKGAQHGPALVCPIEVPINSSTQYLLETGSCYTVPIDCYSNGGYDAIHHFGDDRCTDDRDTSPLAKQNRENSLVLSEINSIAEKYAEYHPSGNEEILNKFYTDMVNLRSVAFAENWNYLVAIQQLLTLESEFYSMEVSKTVNSDYLHQFKIKLDKSLDFCKVQLNLDLPRKDWYAVTCICIAIRSKISAIETQRDTLMVADLESFLDYVTENMKRIRDLKQERSYYKTQNHFMNYKNTIDKKKEEAHKFIQTTVQTALFDVITSLKDSGYELKNELTGLLNDTQDKIVKLNAYTMELQEHIKTLNRNMWARFAFGLLKVVAVGVSILVPGVGPVVAAVAAGALEATKKFAFPDPETPIMPKLSASILQVEKSVYQASADSSGSMEMGINYNVVANKVTKGGEEIISVASDMKNSFDKIDDVNTKIEMINATIMNLTIQVKELEAKIIDLEENFLPSIIETIKTIKPNLEGESISSLDVKKYEIKKKLENMQNLISNFTSGLKTGDAMVLCVDKLNEVFNLEIKLYENIQVYEEQLVYAEFIKNISSSNNEIDGIRAELNNELGEGITALEMAIQLNIFFKEYQTALSAYKKWVFPYARNYLEADNSLENYNELASFSFGNLSMSDAYEFYARRVESMRSEVQRYYRTFEKRDRTKITAQFTEGSLTSMAFYVWDSSTWFDSITELLLGYPIRLMASTADSRPTRNRRGAIKFKEIEMAIRAIEDDDQRFVQNILKYFAIEFTHSGTSYYNVNQTTYVIYDNPVSYYHSFEKTAGGNHESFNEILAKQMRHGNHLLSPYTLWTMQLYDPISDDDDEVNITMLAGLIGKVYIALEGSGIYLDERKFETYDWDQVEGLDNYYQVYKDLNSDAVSIHPPYDVIYPTVPESEELPIPPDPVTTTTPVTTTKAKVFPFIPDLKPVITPIVNRAKTRLEKIQLPKIPRLIG